MDSGKDTGREILEMSSLDELKQLLECPVCREIPFPPIYQCGEGHIMCSSCRGKLSKCAFCKVKLTNIRNRFMESMLYSAKFRCDYQESGCRQSIMGNVFQKHLEECGYRPIICHFGCTDGMPIECSEFLEHLTRVHEYPLYPASADGHLVESYAMTLPASATAYWPAAIWKFDGEFFLTRIVKSGPIVYFNLAIFGTDENASAYAVKIKFGDGGREEEDLVYLGNVQARTKFTAVIPVTSIRTTDEDLLPQSMFTMTQAALEEVGTMKGSTNNNNKQVVWQTYFKVIKRPSATKVKSNDLLSFTSSSSSSPSSSPKKAKKGF